MVTLGISDILTSTGPWALLPPGPVCVYTDNDGVLTPHDWRWHPVSELLLVTGVLEPSSEVLPALGLLLHSVRVLPPASPRRMPPRWSRRRRPMSSWLTRDATSRTQRVSAGCSTRPALTAPCSP